MSSSPFKMTVDLNVLDHLADGLYSSVAAVLTETVANAWDADAQSVAISLDIAKDSIVIMDDGHGMNVKAINDRYLRVGYRRRDEGDTTPSGRPVMGRKGIGKLSLFSIADSIEIRTKASGSASAGLRIAAEDLRRAMEDKSSEYNPVSLRVSEAEFERGQGTRILLSALKRGRLREMAPESLRRRLARRFSIIGSTGFRVVVNDTEVTVADREDLRFVEYLWTFGDSVVDTSLCARLKMTTLLDGRDPEWDKSWRLRGWIGTVDRPKSLATPEGNLNSIIVVARGRLVDEDVLGRIAGAEVYTKYLTGQVEADFLDTTDQGDIVTSNRQRVIEDDHRVSALIAVLRKSVRKIAEAWSDLRGTDKTSELRTRYPGVGEWLDGLPQGWKAKAEKLLERIATMEVSGDEEDLAKGQRTLLRHAIYGFERLRLRGNAEELELALDQGVDALLKLLSDRDSLEAAFYTEIVGNRLEVIDELAQLVDANQRERVLQKYLFDHLWLLDPAWERATGSEEMEKRLRLLSPFNNDETTKAEYGRIDIQYRTVAAKHVIVELKRASVPADIYTLAQQGAKYVDAVRKMLPAEEKDRASVEVVFVVGENPSDSSERIEHAMNSVAPGSRIVTYDTLIRRAQAAYSSYLEGAKSADRIDALFAEEGAQVDSRGTGTPSKAESGEEKAVSKTVKVLGPSKSGDSKKKEPKVRQARKTASAKKPGRGSGRRR